MLRPPPGTCPPIILDNIRRFEQGLSLLHHIDAAQAVDGFDVAG
jgi:hypothetical protein